MKNKLISNFIYQGIYQLTLIILPIITIPIVSHSLGVKGIGIYNYIMSIVSYFILTAGLGLSNYGIREIASVNDNKNSLSKKFWELEFFNIIVAGIVLILYVIFILFIDTKTYFLIAGLSLIATLFDISWFYYGIQDFKQITIINIFIKIISFSFILFYIKNEQDLFKYFLIQGVSVICSNMLLWFFLKSKIFFIMPKFKDIIKHLKPALHYFIGKISITLYTTLNKTLLGILGTTILVGIYTNSLQLITIFVTLIGTIDTVLLPHMTKLYSGKNNDAMIILMEKSIDIQLYLSIPLSFGIVATNSKLIPWFFGNDFSYLEKTVPILSPLLVVIPLGISVVRQYLMPRNKIREFNLSVLIAAVVSVTLNLILIPFIGIWGAIVSTIVSECIVTIVRLVDLKRNTTFKFNYKGIGVYLFSGCIMLIVLNFLTSDWSPTILTSVIQALLGIIIYLILTTILKKNAIINTIKWKKK